ncbi:MAG: flagellar hook-basal body complex protein FliE [Thermoplasmata archaeon]|nr:MAG: flagellar hook-basal body complex protein FliE [Thermoplasmata archaeon]
MKVIVLAGMPGSGKEEFVKIASQEGIFAVRMGEVVREEVKSRGLELTDSNIGRIASKEREKHGFGIWAKRTVPLVEGDVVLIDGIRGETELEVFKRAFGDDMVLVGIRASPEIRYERIVKRNREDATITWEAFLERDSREIGWGIESAIDQCDHMILNEGSLKDFQDEVRNLLKTLK